MKALITSLLICILFLASGCYTVKLNYAPDESIPIFSESPLIQASISEKRMNYKLGFMKKKGERFKLLHKIQSLNATALSRFKARTLTEDKYSGICAISTITLQLVTWIAIIENSQGKLVGKTVNTAEIRSVTSLKVNNPELTSLLSKSNLETDDGIVDFLKQVIAVIEQVLK